MSRIDLYPRQGAPLLPPALVPLLGERRVRRSIIRRYGLPDNLRLGDLDAQVWNEFPPNTVIALGDEVIAATRGAFTNLARSEELVHIDPSGGGLSLRARNALFRAGLLGAPWLDRVPLGVLARESGVGAKTLLEWLVAGASVEAPEAPPEQEIDAGTKRSASGGTCSRAVRKAAERIRRRRWSESVSSSDPRLGQLVGALHEKATTAREAAELLEEAPFQPAAARSKTRQLEQFRTQAEQLRRLRLEDELDQIVDALLRRSSSSGRTAARLRLGLTGSPPMTLAAAGEAVGISRERVRQVEQQLVDEARETRPWTPVLDKALKLVRDAAPIKGAEAELLLIERGLASTSFSVLSLGSAAALFGRDTGFKYDRESAVVYGSGGMVSPRVVTSEARRLTAHWGATTVDTLAAELADRSAADVDPAVLRLYLDSVDGVQWLDDEKEWFWVKGTSRNRLLNQVEKIMSVAGSIEIGELREGVGRFYRMEGFRPPREVLARLCEESGLYRRDGDLIMEGSHLRSWEEVLGSSIERRIAEALFEHGPVMRRDDLEQIVVEEKGVNRSSFYVYLGYSPIVARYGPGVYGLRGARVTAAEVNALIPPRTQRRRLLDHGWTSDGRVWLGYRLSAAALQAGVLSVPAALEGFVGGSYLLFAENDRPIGTLVIKGNHMWGVSPFYRRWGVEEGDFLVVVIDISDGRATISAGGEELLLRFQEGD